MSGAQLREQVSSTRCGPSDLVAAARQVRTHVPVIHRSTLEFSTLPGRLSADPFAGGPVRDCSVRVVRIAPGPRTPHRHPHSSEVIYVIAGAGFLWEDGGRTDVAAGDLIVIPPGVPHATVAGASGLDLVCFFPHPDLDGNLEELAEPRIDG